MADEYDENAVQYILFHVIWMIVVNLQLVAANHRWLWFWFSNGPWKQHTIEWWRFFYAFLFSFILIRWIAKEIYVRSQTNVTNVSSPKKANRKSFSWAHKGLIVLNILTFNDENDGKQNGNANDFNNNKKKKTIAP